MIDHNKKIIPVPELIKALNKLPRSSDNRLVISLLFITGCRLKEIDAMRRDMIDREAQIIYWYKGKNQRGIRKAKLTNDWLKEYDEYLEKHGTPPNNRLFMVKAESLRRQLNYVRSFLGGVWLDKRKVWRAGAWQEEYIYQFKFIRKAYQTMDFYKKWSEYGDAGVAAEFVCKDMGHSSKGITITHYVEGWNDLGLLVPITPQQALAGVSNQTTLMSFY